MARPRPPRQRVRRLYDTRTGTNRWVVYRGQGTTLMWFHSWEMALLYAHSRIFWERHR